MNQFRLLKPEQAAARAKERVAAFKREKDLAEARGRAGSETGEKRKPSANPAAKEPSVYFVGKCKEELNNELLRACEAGDKEWVYRYLRGGADMNAKNISGGTVLIGASIFGHTGVVELLIEKGADVDAKDNDGWTPLIHAAKEGHVKVVRLLIDAGADVNAAGILGSTAMFWAKHEGRTEIVELLRAHGATE